MRITVLPNESWTRRNRNLPRANRDSRVCRMLVVRGGGAVSHAFVHEMSKMADGMTSFKEKSTQGRYPVAEATGKDVASGTASK